MHHIPQNSVLRVDINVPPYSHILRVHATYKGQKSRKEVQQFLPNCPPSDSHFFWRSLCLPHAKNEVSHLEHLNVLYTTDRYFTLRTT